jgi:uncharacterized protein
MGIHPQVRVVVRPYGSSVPLGFFAFGIGMFLCIAMYGGIAFLLEDALGRTVLPLGRQGRSREAVEGSLSDQLRRLEDEAGVRHTL